MSRWCPRWTLLVASVSIRRHELPIGFLGKWKKIGSVIWMWLTVRRGCQRDTLALCLISVWVVYANVYFPSMLPAPRSPRYSCLPDNNTICIIRWNLVKGGSWHLGRASARYPLVRTDIELAPLQQMFACANICSFWSITAHGELAQWVASRCIRIVRDVASSSSWLSLSLSSSPPDNIRVCGPFEIQSGTFLPTIVPKVPNDWCLKNG